MELLNTFTVLFIVVDPIGIAPVFAALTAGLGAHEQRRIAVRSTLLAAGILLLFFLIGDSLLMTLGISLPAFRIAGGLLLLLLSIDMMFARQSGLRSTTVREQKEAEHKHDITVFPLAFPLIAGPGAITTLLLMASSWRGTGQFLGMLGVIAAVLALTLLFLVFAMHLRKVLGETGANVISRLFGLILTALAVQFMIDGTKAVFHL